MMHVTLLAAFALLFGFGFAQPVWQYSGEMTLHTPTSHSIVFDPGFIGVKDVQVFVKFLHESIGDLVISITHEESQRKVKLLDRQCSGEGLYPVWLEFSDETSNVLDCDNVDSAGLKIIAPSEPLSLFDGLSGHVHTFTLSIEDEIGQITGELQRWGVGAVEDPSATLHPTLPSQSPTQRPTAFPTNPTANPSPAPVPSPTTSPVVPPPRVSKVSGSLSNAIPTSNSISFGEYIGLERVQAYVSINHDSIGDLVISLTHEESQTTVKLFDKQCGTVGNNPVRVHFSDDTSNVLNCASAASGLLGVIPPSEALSLFDGLSGDGHTFTLSIDDVNGADTGQLLDWGVRFYVHKYVAFSGLRSWDTARDKCWDTFRTDLAIIHSYEDMTESKQLCEQGCVSAYGSQCQGCWIGLSDRETEGTFVYIDGSNFSLPGRRTDWGANEPNDLNGEDCAEIRSAGYRWNDGDCAETNRVPLCRSPSLQDFVALANASSSWSEARTMCQAMNKDLAVYQWEGHIYEGRQICREVCDRISWCQGCWIGKSDTATEGTFEWYDRYLMDGEPTESTDWTCAAPSNTASANNKDCVALDRYMDYKWIDLPCDARLRIPLCYKYIPIGERWV